MEPQLQAGGTYIVKEKTSLNPSILKVKVLEVTEKTILYENMDSIAPYKIRKLISDFDMEVIEHINTSGLSESNP